MGKEDKDKKNGNGEEGDPPKPKPKTDDATGAEKLKGGDKKVEFSAEQQAYLDKIIGERLGRQETNLRERWDKEHEETQRKAKEEAEQKRLEEEKKWQELAEKRAGEVADTQAKLGERDVELIEVRIRHAIEITAATMDFQNPADAYDLTDIAVITIDDGKVEGVEDALKKLAEEKPYLIKSERERHIGTPRASEKKKLAKGAKTEDIRLPRF